MDVWEPQVGEVLVLEREPQNVADQFAVSVVRSGRIVNKCLKTGRGPINFDTSTCVMLLLIDNMREIYCAVVKSVVVS